MNKNILVKQATVDEMKRLGMSKAIERANSGSASEEQVEAAKRFYGNRITGKAKKIGGPKMRPEGPQSAVVNEAKAPDRGHVINEARANPVSKKEASKYQKMA